MPDRARARRWTSAASGPGVQDVERPFAGLPGPQFAAALRLLGTGQGKLLQVGRPQDPASAFSPLRSAQTNENLFSVTPYWGDPSRVLWALVLGRLPTHLLVSFSIPSPGLDAFSQDLPNGFSEVGQLGRVPNVKTLNVLLPSVLHSVKKVWGTRKVS